MTSTLLFVDDEPSILSSLRRLFRQHGYEMFAAESAAQALEILEKEAIDLVISDMRMPEMDGARFLEQVRLRWPNVVRLLLTGYADITSTIAAINCGEIYRYIAKPWDDSDIVLTVRDALEHQRLVTENARLLALTQQQNDKLKALNASLEQKVAERTAQLQQALKELKRSFVDTVHVFSSLIELRGGELGGHARRVADYARAIAQRLGLNDAEVQDVILAALLHDIGKIGLPDQVLQKPFNTLSVDLREEVMKHAQKGQSVLMGITQLKNVALLIRHHHESFDGSGYPDHLTGLAIPLGSRILAVANEYDALQFGTLVSWQLKQQEALRYLLDNRGRRYDPAVVEAFSSWLAEEKKMPSGGVGVRPASLRPGMELAQDLLHKDGYLLLTKGYRFEPDVIAQLTRMEQAEKQSVTVFVKETPNK